LTARENWGIYCQAILLILNLRRSGLSRDTASGKVDDMNRSVDLRCSRAISLFRGLYGRVARDFGVDVSYVSRIARGERRSEVIEDAIYREFNTIQASINKSPHPSAKHRNEKKALTKR
jgi:hypothetical protein